MDDETLTWDEFLYTWADSTKPMGGDFATLRADPDDQGAVVERGLAGRFRLFVEYKPEDGLLTAAVSTLRPWQGYMPDMGAAITREWFCDPANAEQLAGLTREAMRWGIQAGELIDAVGPASARAIMGL